MIYATVNLHCEDHSLIKMVNNALEHKRENLSVTKNKNRQLGITLVEIILQ